MIPRLGGRATHKSRLSAVFQVSLLLVSVLLPLGAQSFFHGQQSFIAPLNNAGLLINQLLLNTANVSSLLDRNIDHIRRPVGEYPSIEERSDNYLGSESSVSESERGDKTVISVICNLAIN